MSFFSVSSSIFSSPFQNSSVKIGFFVGEAFQNALFSLKIGFAPKRPFDNFAPGKKKKRDVFRGPLSWASCRIHVFHFRKKKTDETTRNVVYSVSAPKSQNFVAAFPKLTVFDVPAEACEITV